VKGTGTMNTTTGGTEMKNTITPTVGMSVSYQIGSDTYHEIIIKTERNARTIHTVNADVVCGFWHETLEQWNSNNETAKASKTIIAFQDRMECCVAYEMSWNDGTTEERANAIAFDRLTSKYTKRADGSYRTAGSDHGFCQLNSQREYLDPSF
jgi:hypothetical protein